MDFGTFYRMRQMRERGFDMTDDDLNQSENFSHPPVELNEYHHINHPPHTQFNCSRGFEGDEDNLYRNSAIGRDFDYDQSWEFKEERDLENFDRSRDQRGMGRAKGQGRGSGPHDRKGRPGGGWPSDSESFWIDHVDAVGPWYHEDGDKWGEETRNPVKYRENQNNSSNRNELGRETDLRRPMISEDPQHPADNANVRIPLEEALPDISKNMTVNDPPDPRSDGLAPTPTKEGETQSLIDQKLDVKKDVKTDKSDGNTSSQDMKDQKGEIVPECAVSVDRNEGKTRDKLLEKDVACDIEDMAVSQLQDHNRTEFSCCYCGVSSNSVDEFRDHVKGNFHRENFASLIKDKRRRLPTKSLTEFKREELGMSSFLELDLDSFRKEPVVGLSYVTEVQSIFGIKCICHLCGTMFSQIGGQHHVTSFQHRMRYMREKRFEDYKYIVNLRTKRARLNVMFRVLGNVEWHDGRGTPTIYVFEGEPNSEGSSSDDLGAVKFRQAFGEFVNKELQVARQKITDDPLPFDDDNRGGDTFSEQSEYVQLCDLGGQSANFFDEHATVEKDFSSNLGWEFPEERDYFGGAGTTGYRQRDPATKGERGHQNAWTGIALVPDYDSSYEDDDADDDDTYDSMKLGTTDVFGPSSISKAKSEKKRPSKEQMKHEKDQKDDDQEGIEGINVQKQEGDEKGNSEEKEIPVRRQPMTLIPKHEYGKISLLQKLIKEQAKGPVIGSKLKYHEKRCTQDALNRKYKPKIYAKISGLQTRNKIMAQLLPVVEDLERKEGRGKPVIEVFQFKKNSENEASDSTSVSDNQEQDPWDASMSQAKLEKWHLEYLHFIQEERSKQMARTTEPIPFEQGQWRVKASDEHNNADPQLKNPLFRPDPSLQRPQVPDPHFQGRPLRPDPYLREHDPYFMRMRADPYFNPHYFERLRRGRPYPDEGPLPYPMKRMRPDESYLDPDPLKRIRRGEPYLDPDPLKRMAQRESHLAPDPSKRFRFDEPYIDPDPLKRVLPSQKAAVKKPVVIDYAHGAEKKSVKNTADQWEEDIKDILNESKGPDSLAQLSCSYSSPKREDTPPLSQPKRQLPFSRSYMEKSKELKQKLSSSKKKRNQHSPQREEHRGRYRSGSPSSKKEKSQYSPKREESKGQYKSDHPSRGLRRTGKLLSVEHRKGAKLEDLVRRSRTDTSPKRHRHSKSPESKDSASKRSYKRSKSPDNLNVETIQKKKDQTFVKRKTSKSPVKEKMISSSKEKDKDILLPRKSSPDGKDLSAREYKKSKSPERFDLRMKFRDSERAYGVIGPNSTNPEEDKVDSHLKTFSMLKGTGNEKVYFNHPENPSSNQKGSERPGTFIDLTINEEIGLPSTSRNDVHSIHTNVAKSLPRKEQKPETSDIVDEAQAVRIAEMLLTMEPKPETSDDIDEAQSDRIAEMLLTMKSKPKTSDDVDEAQSDRIAEMLLTTEPKPETINDTDEAKADLIAEMLLTMKNKLIGKDADPESALKAILSQDITKVLLATKELEEKESPKVKQVRQDERKRDSLERFREEKAGSSERHFDLKSKAKKTPAPAREKIAFAFAGRSRASGNLASQSALHFSDDDDDDEMENN